MEPLWNLLMKYILPLRQRYLQQTTAGFCDFVVIYSVYLSVEDQEGSYQRYRPQLHYTLSLSIRQITFLMLGLAS